MSNIYNTVEMTHYIEPAYKSYYYIELHNKSNAQNKQAHFYNNEGRSNNEEFERYSKDYYSPYKTDEEAVYPFKFVSNESIPSVASEDCEVFITDDKHKRMQMGDKDEALILYENTFLIYSDTHFVFLLYEKVYTNLINPHYERQAENVSESSTMTTTNKKVA